jgi:hypothetical protein
MAKDQPYILIEDKKARPKKNPLPKKGVGFRLDKRGNLNLVRPESWKQVWPLDERSFRSLIFSEKDHLVRSVGFPKFMSPEKDESAAQDLEKALAEPENDVIFIRKYDGTLIIRSAWAGVVSWRTRSAFDLEGYEMPVKSLVESRYTSLSDPETCPNLSLQFEFISPKTRVILPYPEDDLILVGATNNKTLIPLPFEEVEALARTLGVRVAEEVSLQGRSIKELQAEVNSDPTTEGVVARWNSGQRFLRIKSSHYRSLHRKRFELHPRRIIQSLEGKSRTDQELLKRLEVSESDPLVPYVLEVKACYERLNEDIPAEIARLEEMLKENSTLTRKKFSELAHSFGAPSSLALLALRDKKAKDAEKLLRDHWTKERFGDPTAL